MIKFAELDAEEKKIADNTCEEINKFPNYFSEAVHNRQYILEEVIKILEERV